MTGFQMTGFEAFLAAEFPGARITEISGSNNRVHLVRTGTSALVAKHVTDTDIPLDYLAAATEALARHLPTQRILRVYQCERGDPYDAVFAEYVEGRDLATVLAQDPGAVPAAELVDLLCRFVLACRDLPRLRDGFTMYKRDAPEFASHQEFAEYYANRYWGRVRPFYLGTPVAELVDGWLAGGFAAATSRHPAPFSVTAIDANLKNFIVTPEHAIVVLNVPIAAVSTPAHAVGAISAHLRHQPAHRLLLDAVADGICAADVELVAHFEAWALLGILSFYAVRQPELRDQWCNWGSPVPLYEDFANLVQEHLTGAVRP